MEVAVTESKTIEAIIRDTRSKLAPVAEGIVNTEEDDLLPFAMAPSTGCSSTTDMSTIGLDQRRSVGNCSDSKHFSSASSSYSFSRQHQLKDNNIPELQSSIVSSRTGGSQCSYNSRSLDMSLLNRSVYDSSYLDTAASILCSGDAPKIELNGRDSELFLFSKYQGECRKELESASIVPLENQNHSEQQLTGEKSFVLKNQSLEHHKQQQSTSRLPTLSEEVAFLSSSSIVDGVSRGRSDSKSINRTTAFSNLNDEVSSRFLDAIPFLNSFTDGSTTILPEAMDLMPGLMPKNMYLNSPQSHRSHQLASLAGAVINRTGDRSFQVTIDLSARSVSNVMDILGNPALLPLWFDPIMSSARLVVTKSSEGARTEWNWRGAIDDNNEENTRTNREYEGEWVEATLLAPLNEPTSRCSKITSCLHQTCRLISTAIGFPTFGRISMFVERLKGNVSLTVGSFVGGIELHHSIRIEVVGNNKVRIVDDVRIRKDEDAERIKSSIFGDVSNVFQQCYLPYVQDYMDQVLTSMARLRFLIENGAISETERGLLVIGETRCPCGSQTADRHHHSPLTIPLISPVS